MTTARENEILTRIGPGTPMGDVMRQYWVPIGKSDEVKTDGDPVRIMVLGEPLIAFRDTSGRLGVMDHRCAHRCASLFFGRNEANGIRCIYHGWKFDVDGNCVDMPNVPPHQDFKHSVKAKSYKVLERYGVIWVYMGERQECRRRSPITSSTISSDDEITIQMLQQEYNWLQGLENDLDTSHFGFLHLGGADPNNLVPGDTMHYLCSDRTPQFHIEETPLGLMYGAYRPADETNVNTHWRLAQLVVPCWVIPPAAMLEDQIMIKGYIPMDDTHTLVYHDQPRDHAAEAARAQQGRQADPGARRHAETATV